MNGFITLLKPPGMTSSAAVLAVRKRLPRGTKVGHAGTLDPEAAGVLPIMIGKATRLFDLVTDKEKTYVAQWKPGVSTDTQDAFGEAVAYGRGEVDANALEAVLPRFTGEIPQVPPMFSALKRDGQRLYDLARKGETVPLQPRPVWVHEIRVLSKEEDGSFLIRVRCGRGTYIRTLCHDLGKALGCEAHMGMLLRTSAGPFTLDNAVTLEEVAEADDLTPLLMPMDAPLGHLRAVTLGKSEEKRVLSGNPIRLKDERFPDGQIVRVYMEEVFCGIARLTGGEIRFQAMLLER